MQHERGPERTTTAAIEYWKRERPALLFIHLDNVDQAGHDVGWKRKQYYRAVEKADAQIGRVLEMLDRESARSTTFVLVTSDHGGTKRGHGKNSLEEILIPWILEGPDVTPGEIKYPVNTYDTAVTMAWIYNLQIPACWSGRPVIAAFQPALVSSREGPAARLAGAACISPAQRAGMTLVPAAEPVTTEEPAAGATGQH
jgi:arylsulfatase A-like enzyme